MNQEELKDFKKRVNLKKKELEKANKLAFKYDGLNKRLEHAHLEVNHKKHGALEYIKDAEERGLLTAEVANAEIKTLLDSLSSKSSVVNQALFTFQSGDCFPYENRFNDETTKFIEALRVTHAHIHYGLDKAYKELLPLALEIRELEKEYEIQREITTQITSFQRAISELKSKENEEIFSKYIRGLENWTPSELIDDEIIVNGKNIGKSGVVGIKIGRGNRIHLMEVGIVVDKETNEKSIGAYNGTRWYGSDLAIIDTKEDIPKELISLIS
ncbi:hypothetical protein [Poseidonibacter ostreae]|uniref:Uncharacterized protein n=1 Tax=Poseidonibacter ostreae TaxID=2654171 RepID=A0A6L4WX46_9BACT|nr:hypothetical protein [Poseidonibacter ostreae]KAB7891425.1 hypothetical protein GBG19_00890 [Poseidonibacter ostreae]